MRQGYQPPESGAKVCTFNMQETWTLGSESGCVSGLKGHLATEDMKTKRRCLSGPAGWPTVRPGKKEAPLGPV